MNKEEKKNILKEISQNLTALMNQIGISSAELARRCEISTGTISKIINGDTGLSVPMLLNLADGLKVNPLEILGRSTHYQKSEPTTTLPLYYIGTMSIKNKIQTYIIDKNRKVIGTSEKEGVLDLTESGYSLFTLIKDSIKQAMQDEDMNYKMANITIVLQSYEFIDSRDKFSTYLNKYFNQNKLIPDWYLTYVSNFENYSGMSLVIDKGVSISFMNKSELDKVGGWKFPVYDLRVHWNNPQKCRKKFPNVAAALTTSSFLPIYFSV